MAVLRFPQLNMKAIIITILVTLFFNANGQVKDYSKYINDQLINKKQTAKTPDDKEEIIYLGKIKSSNGKILFYILSIYSEVQAAIQIHGHSNVLYLDREKVIKKQFDLGLPDELPFKLKNNTLYFHYYNDKTKKTELYANHVGTGLPKILCVGPEDCY
jgi:hypothetical protein